MTIHATKTVDLPTKVRRAKRAKKLLGQGVRIGRAPGRPAGGDSGAARQRCCLRANKMLFGFILPRKSAKKILPRLTDVSDEKTTKLEFAQDMHQARKIKTRVYPVNLHPGLEERHRNSSSRNTTWREYERKSELITKI